MAEANHASDRSVGLQCAALFIILYVVFVFVSKTNTRALAMAAGDTSVGCTPDMRTVRTVIALFLLRSMQTSAPYPFTAYARAARLPARGLRAQAIPQQ